MPSERVQRQIDRLLDEAEQASAKKDWAAVADRAQHALTFDPSNEDALELLEVAKRALGKEGEALAATSLAPKPVPANASPLQPTAPPHPTSFASGRYAVKRFLGEGGRGCRWDQPGDGLALVGRPRRRTDAASACSTRRIPDIPSASTPGEADRPGPVQREHADRQSSGRSSRPTASKGSGASASRMARRSSRWDRSTKHWRSGV